VKTIILWISGGGNDGKTTLRRQLLLNSNIPFFKIDSFNIRMDLWFPDKEILKTCQEFGMRKRRNVVDYLHKAGYGKLYAKQFLEHEMGFHPRGTINVIDGYLHKNIQDMISKSLENRGHYVWYAMRRHRLKNICNDNNWQ